MHRPWFLLAGLGLSTLAAGCCMCDAPYDYCGPTFLARPGEECVSDARMNSAFTPYVPYAVGHPTEVIEGVPPGATFEAAPAEAGRTEADSPSDAMPRPTFEPTAPTPAPAPAAGGLDPMTTRAPMGRPVSLRR